MQSSKMFVFNSLVASLFVCSILAKAASAASVGPSSGQIKNLVTFGDSYTDVVSAANCPTRSRAYPAP